MMTKIALQAERHLQDLDYMEMIRFKERVQDASRDDLFSLNIKLISETMSPRLIIVPSKTGATARRVARFRMPQWIIAGSHQEQTCQRLQFSWGVFPRLVDQQVNWDDATDRHAAARRWCEEFDVTSGLVILIEGAGTLKAHDTRRIDIVDLG